MTDTGVFLICIFGMVAAVQARISIVHYINKKYK